MFEKQDTQIDKSWPVYAHPLPNMLVLKDFEENLDKFVRETETGSNILPINLAA